MIHILNVFLIKIESSVSAAFELSEIVMPLAFFSKHDTSKNKRINNLILIEHMASRISDFLFLFLVWIHVFYFILIYWTV